MTAGGVENKNSAPLASAMDDCGRAEELERMPLKGFMGLRFLDQSLVEVADWIVNSAKNRVGRHLFFVNAHCVNIAAENAEYAMLLHKSPFVLPDGVGIAIAARIWGSKICNNLNGTDLFPELCRRAAATGISIAFLGGRQGIAAECARLMVARYPGLQIVWVGHGYLSPAEEAQLIPELNASGASLLFVAKGVPTQEIWIRDNGPNLDIPILIGVGALFDFYSGAMPRAPAFLRKLRLEWLFRLFMEPARMFKRYVIGNPQFIIRTIRQRIVGH